MTNEPTISDPPATRTAVAAAPPAPSRAPDPLESHVAFNLGWDIAYYGLPCDIPDTLVQSGYTAGKERFMGGTRREADRFTRKWLLLRTNAWHRGRVFAEEVTPAYLKRIDTKVCPIVGIALTHGTGLDTDASIDRVNNDGAYAIGNLAVMSARANQAKGRLSLAEVLDRASGAQGLELSSTKEWFRLASLMEGPCALNGAQVQALPFLLPAIRGVRVTRAQALQFVLRLEAYNYRNVHIIRPIRKTCLVMADRKGFDGLVKRLRKRRQARMHPQDFWWSEGLFSAFVHWYEKLQPQSIANIEAVLLARTRYAQGNWDTQAWCLDSLGYYDVPGEEGAEDAGEPPTDLPEEPCSLEAL
jgi:hypothetical protein